MDSTDPDITFDEDGVCNHCREYEETVAWKLPEASEARRELEAVVDRIKAAGKGQDYDCIIGLSGGVDSSYLAYQAKELGLRPLAVHLDNGWDSELAVQNIENVVTRLGLDLYTHVVDWEEFRDIQRAFFRASVVDIELITDHAITAYINRVALKERVRFILSGSNVVTEGVMPASWGHRKSDLRNLKAIQRRFGTKNIRSLPTASTLRIQWWQHVRRIKPVYLLEYLDYDKQKAIAILETELGWRSYGGKHYESLFTRFYQTYVLPRKFGIDKRKAHLSALICSGQLSRDEALAELEEELFDRQMLEMEKEYTVKKLGFSLGEFDALMAEPPRSHLGYPCDELYVRPLLNLKKGIRNRRNRRIEARRTAVGSVESR